MIHFGESALGNKQYVCARCSQIREIGEGYISAVKGSYGFITTTHRDIFFHFRNISPGLNPCKGQHVMFEVAFKDRGIEAIHVTDTLNNKGGIL
ncbi:MAG: cold shock domain-containing protein [Candidatus Magnetomorum sp.]|nr:cold shock domain-containing protein [Candidatus Magnetomorum sp.]